MAAQSKNLPGIGWVQNSGRRSNGIFRISKIERRCIADLKVRKNHTRRHSKKQIAQLARAIERFGETVPIIIDNNNYILNGVARCEALQRLGCDDVAVVQIDYLSDAELKAFAISVQKLGTLAEWNEEALALEFQDLLEINVDVELTGFDTVEIDQIIDRANDKSSQPPQETVPLPNVKIAPTTQPGDLWILGSHRLLCGNALEQPCFDMLMRGDPAQMIITDMPYNVPVHGHVCGLGRVKHREFAMASGEMSTPEFSDFMRQALFCLSHNCVPAAIMFAFMDWKSTHCLVQAGEDLCLEHKNTVVWVKTNAGMGSFYRSQYENIVIFKTSAGQHINNFGLGAKGRYRTNVWHAPGVNTFRKDRMRDLQDHPTCKPTTLYADAMKDCSKRRGIILDSFAGSGTVFLAAERTGRNARGIEIDPHYCDVAIRRWQEFAGSDAVHAETGRTFSEMASLRNRESDSVGEVDA